MKMPRGTGVLIFTHLAAVALTVLAVSSLVERSGPEPAPAVDDDEGRAELSRLRAENAEQQRVIVDLRSKLPAGGATVAEVEPGSGAVSSVPPVAPVASEDPERLAEMARLEKLLLEDPSNRKIGEQYVETAEGLAEIDRVIEFLKKLALDRPEEMWAHYRYSQALATKLGRFRFQLDPMEMGSLFFSSIGGLGRALEIDDGFHEARYFRAVLHYNSPSFMQKNREAIDDLEFLRSRLREEPDNPLRAPVFRELSRAYRKGGNLDKAEEALLEGASEFPEDQSLRDALDELREAQRRPYLGVVTGQVKDENGDHLIIRDVIVGSSADRGGLKPEDEVVRLGETRIRTHEDLINAITPHRIGDEVELVIRRNGKSKTLKLTLFGREDD